MKQSSESLPWGLRVVATVAVVAVALFCGSVVVFNLPASTAKVRLQGAANHVVEPWFDQNWDLFAPTPPSSNMEVQVNTKIRNSNGSVVVGPHFLIQTDIENEVKKTPFAPTKQPGITLAAQERMADYANKLSAIQHGDSRIDKAMLHKMLDNAFQGTFDALNRFISYEAHQRYPGTKITRVQAVFLRTPMVPFSERHDRTAPTMKTSTILTTGWAPYQAGVRS